MVRKKTGDQCTPIIETLRAKPDFQFTLFCQSVLRDMRMCR
jgi:hypothetical protein